MTPIAANTVPATAIKSLLATSRYFSHCCLSQRPSSHKFRRVTRIISATRGAIAKFLAKFLGSVKLGQPRRDPSHPVSPQSSKYFLQKTC
ncbi:MAG: hypothetical protein HC890_15210 [Chloroflexaceae bacterium]|nr:hypothetical protein [Chloroflexaceae bacterium]